MAFLILTNRKKNSFVVDRMTKYMLIKACTYLYCGLFTKLKSIDESEGS